MRINKKISDYPQLLAEWHPNKNGDLKPEHISHKSAKKVWWKCERGHEWQGLVYNRTNRLSCPCCSGRKLSYDNCLAVVFPKVAAEWHPIKNGNITPKDVISQSNKKYWFMCKLGHEWMSTLNGRSNGQNCPYCTGRKVCFENCLATKFPEIAAEWHPTKNGNITPKDVISQSNKKYWFKCKKGHEWQSTLGNRGQGYNCPYCSNQKVCAENCLAAKFPEISAEWHPIKNGNITPEDVLPKSNKKYWFQCPQKHEWKASLSHRSDGKGCPVCMESKGEKNISKLLNLFNIKFKRQWRFKSCCDKLPLPFDFVVKTKNGVKIIEYQGEQHYKPVGFGASKEKTKILFASTKRRDKIKKKWCKERNVELLEIPYWEFNNIESILTKFINT